ncbi:hypothetical protein LTR27_004270 [Elasticomyces elasticus]|nr:hypothetical protein LTR27_004270 [Elasticomyces elasticus]
MAKVLIFGATGVAGKHITHALVHSKEGIAQLGIFTSQNTVDTKADFIEKLKSKRVDIHVGDVTNEQDVLAAYKDYDTIVNAAGRNAILSQIDLLRWAEQTPNIKRFFPSEYGTDIEYSPETSPHEKPHQLKLKVRAFIKEHIKRLEHTYVVTGPYAEMAFGRMPPAIEVAGTFDVQGKRAILLGTGDEPVSYTTMPDLGNLVVAALLHPEEARNKALKVNSFTASGKEVLAEFEKQTGEKWNVKYTPMNELKRLEKEAWEKENPMATVYTLRRIWTEGGTLYKERDNKLIDAEDTETLATVVARVISTQTKAAI